MEVHLKVLERNGIIESWHRRCLPAGADWAEEVDEHLNAADLVLLLVSPDFLASDYCWEVEMDRALVLQNNRRALVVPIILRHCMWSESPLAKLKPLPSSAVPIARWPDPDEAWLDVATGIRQLLTSAAAAGSVGS